MKQHQLDTLVQIAQLTPEEFDRMLPDLEGWFLLMKIAISAGAEPIGFIWIDDGRPGEIFELSIRDGKDSEPVSIRGSAWTEPPHGGSD